MCQATSRIRKDVVSLAAQATELHSTFNSARALGISGGGGGGGKIVAEIVDMAKEIQALTKKVEKLKAQKKAQVATTSLFFLDFLFVCAAALSRRRRRISHAAAVAVCRTRTLRS